ncbi:MAG: hypothetical protein QOH30_3175 [Baekduia sp.]|nr:hypothetical protein [Baekduia sp.]
MTSARSADAQAAPQVDVRGALRHRLSTAVASPWLWVLSLFLVAVGAYVVLALVSPRPVLFPDEFRYAHAARGLADGTGFDWRGEPIRQSAALYVYFITPAWVLLHSTVDAYHASKVLGTVALCAQVIPVWLLAKELLSDARLALLPAGLSVLGTWMLTAAETVTEALAFPLATAALCVGVMALRRPGSRLGWLALLLAVLATWARIQLAVLIPALLAAFVIDALRDPSQRRERLRAHRPYVIVTCAALIGLVVVALAAPSVTGDYSGYFDLRPALSRIASKTGLQLLELVAVSGFLPVLLTVAASASRRAWRDDRTGPLLAVFWPAVVVTVLQSGFFLAGYTPALSAIGRYVSYAVPLALILAVVVAAHPELLSRVGVTLAGVACLLLLLRPGIQMIGEERASWATAFRLHQASGLGVGLALTLVALALVAAVELLRRRRVAPRRAAITVAGLVAAVLVVQSQASWHQMLRTGQAFRATLPADLEWVDHHAPDSVALLGFTSNAPQFDDLDYFNRKIRQAYVPSAGLPGRRVEGVNCTFQIVASGAMQLSPRCGRPAHWFLVNDPSAVVTFSNQLSEVRDPKVGRLIELPRDRVPQVRSLMVLPCPRPSPTFSSTSPDIVPATAPSRCRPVFSGNLWTTAPSRLVVRYQGGSAARTVTLGSRAWTVAPRRVTTIRLNVPAGYSQFALNHDWASSDRHLPTVIGAELITGARRSNLL